MNTARYVVLENATVCHVARTLSCVLTHSSCKNKCTVHDMPRARPPERARAQTVGPNERSRVACRRRCVQHKLAEPEGSSSHPRSSARVPARAPARRARARGDDPQLSVSPVATGHSRDWHCRATALLSLSPITRITNCKASSGQVQGPVTPRVTLECAHTAHDSHVTQHRSHTA